MEYEKNNDILSLEMTIKLAENYAGKDDMSQYMISPINGDFNNLPPTLFFFSTAELIYPDCIKLKSVIKNVKADLQFHVYEQMQHAWLLLPIKERDTALQQSYDFIIK